MSVSMFTDVLRVAMTGADGVLDANGTCEAEAHMIVEHLLTGDPSGLANVARSGLLQKMMSDDIYRKELASHIASMDDTNEYLEIMLDTLGGNALLPMLRSSVVCHIFSKLINRWGVAPCMIVDHNNGETLRKIKDWASSCWVYANPAEAGQVAEALAQLYLFDESLKVLTSFNPRYTVIAVAGQASPNNRDVANPFDRQTLIRRLVSKATIKNICQHEERLRAAYVAAGGNVKSLWCVLAGRRYYYPSQVLEDIVDISYLGARWLGDFIATCSDADWHAYSWMPDGVKREACTSEDILLAWYTWVIGELGEQAMSVKGCSLFDAREASPAELSEAALQVAMNNQKILHGIAVFCSQRIHGHIGDYTRLTRTFRTLCKDAKAVDELWEVLDSSHYCSIVAVQSCRAAIAVINCMTAAGVDMRSSELMRLALDGLSASADSWSDYLVSCQKLFCGASMPSPLAMLLAYDDTGDCVDMIAYALQSGAHLLPDGQLIMPNGQWEAQVDKEVIE